MIKVKPFTFNERELKDKWFEKSKKDVLQKSIDYANGMYFGQGLPNISEMILALKQRVDEEKAEDIEQRTTEVKEVWINPKNIKKIERCTNEMMEKNFLKVQMDDGETFKVEGNSLQEFMLKNIILGNES